MSKYYVERVKKRLKESIESGQIPPDQQFAIIESTIDDLLKVGEINEDAVKDHDTTMEKLSKQMIDTQTQIGEQYKKTYDNILGL